jgi:phosphoesterase RecJ-like protein
MNNLEETASIIWQKIKSANNIILTCHVHPDPDSVGSNLALKLFLEKNGKKVTLISGDNHPLLSSKFLPGFDSIIDKSLTPELLDNHDLFICIDTGGIEQVTSKAILNLPLTIPLIVIDHHPTNKGFGEINYLDTKANSSAEIIFKLLQIWDSKLIDSKIAANLFAGFWSDTGGGRYKNTNSQTFRIGADLIDFGVDHVDIISKLDSQPIKNLRVMGKTLAEARLFFSGKLVIAKIPIEIFSQFGISDEEAGSIKYLIAFNLSCASDTEIAVTIYEYEKGKVNASFRSNNPKHFWNVSVIASSLGGGGHEQAAGAKIYATITEAENIILEKIRQIYPELGEA